MPLLGWRGSLSRGRMVGVMNESILPAPVASDVDADVPFSLIDPAPWNSDIKSPITGVYRQGLEANLDTYGNRDRLRLWPRPDAPGRYYVLNGNQRLRIFTDRVVSHGVRKLLGAEAKSKDIEAFIDDPENRGVVEGLRMGASGLSIPCRIMTEVREGVPMSREDAIEFTAAWDRNQARFSEAGNTRLYRQLLMSERMQRDEALRARLKRRLRPELAAAASPLPEPVAPVPPLPAVERSPEKPWGDPPEAVASPARVASREVPAPVFVPVMFSMTVDSAEKLKDTIMLCRSRMLKNRRLAEAVGSLASLLESRDLDDTLDSMVVEAALLHATIKAMESNGEHINASRDQHDE